MGATTGIKWCDHTFNPWRGCTKVSAGCTNCYAETLSRRNPDVLGVWGDDGKRAMAAESYWRQPVQWNKSAERDGVRRRVFCSSLADVFEDRPELVSPRRRLWDLIMATPSLDWLLLTKRPQNVARMLGPNGIGVYAKEGIVPCPQPNVWIGASTEDQRAYEERIEHLMSAPAAVRFISYEPALTNLELDANRGGVRPWHDGRWLGVDWVICGCESGAKRRPMRGWWARSVRDQCRDAGVAFFMKQMEIAGSVTDDVNDFPEELRIQEFPR